MACIAPKKDSDGSEAAPDYQQKIHGAVRAPTRIPATCAIANTPMNAATSEVVSHCKLGGTLDYRVAVTAFAHNGTSISKPASIQNAACSPVALATKPITAGPARMPA